MLQLKRFEITEDEKANKFVKEHFIIENGIQVRDNGIYVLYDDATELDEYSRTKLLLNNKCGIEAKLIEANIACEYYELADNNSKLTPELMQKRTEAWHSRDMLEAQHFIVKRLLKEDTHGMKVFGKRYYSDKKDHESNTEDNSA